RILDPFDHRAQTIAAGHAQVLEQIQLREVILDIEGQNSLRRLAVVSGQHHSQQPLDDKGIAVSIEIQAATLRPAGQPDLALTTAHDIALGTLAVIQRWQLATEIDDVLVAIFPAVKE